MFGKLLECMQSFLDDMQSFLECMQSFLECMQSFLECIAKNAKNATPLLTPPSFGWTVPLIAVLLKQSVEFPRVYAELPRVYAELPRVYAEFPRALADGCATACTNILYVY